MTTGETGIDLDGADQAGGGLNIMVGLAREDLLGAVTMMLRETAGNPLCMMKLGQAIASDMVSIATLRSDLKPDPKDKRFLDPAWQQNPLFRMSMQTYLAAQKHVKSWVTDLEVDDLERARVNFVTSMIMDSLAPGNTLAGNPAAIKKTIETGGQSLMRGLKNAYDDMVKNDGIVSQVDSRPFKIGENIAIQPGAVVHCTPMMELIQYAPTTADVHAIPLLIIPPQINKAYLQDLTPDKSMIRFMLANGIQPFLISWRNPTIEHRDWGLGHYVDEIIAAMDVVNAVTGSHKINVTGGCSGGITMATLLSKLKARGDDRANCATAMVCILNPERNDSEVGALVSDNGIKLARERSAKKGVLEGTSLSRMFAWLRPNDLVWNYVVNNYLLGEDPPAFDILFWNNDSTNLTAALHSDYLRVYEEQPFLNHGASHMADHALDISKVDCDLFILGGVTDHITPWKACYRSTQLFGSASIDFVLSHSGHIQAIVNPPGNPKAKYYHAEGGKPPATAEAWLKTAREHAGSWWPFWMQWLQARSGPHQPAPAALGNAAHPPGAAAPGTYVFN